MVKSELRELIKKWMPFKMDVFGIDKNTLIHIADEIYYYLEAEYPVEQEALGTMLYGLLINVGAQKRYKVDVEKSDCVAISKHLIAIFDRGKSGQGD